MKLKNTITAGVALAATCGAMTAGILVTSGAMADSSPSSPGSADVVVGTVDASGQAYRCHFTGVQIPVAPTGSLLTALPSSGVVQVGVSGGASTQIVSGGDGTPVSIVLSAAGGDGSSTAPVPMPVPVGGDGKPVIIQGSVSVSADGSATPMSGSIVLSGDATSAGLLPQLDPTGASALKVISLDDAREGTKEECAALAPTTATAATQAAPGAPATSAP
jgi:hypothetical protein